MKTLQDSDYKEDCYGLFSSKDPTKVRTSISLPPQLREQIDETVSEDTQFQSRSDFFRKAARHLLQGGRGMRDGGDGE